MHETAHEISIGTTAVAGEGYVCAVNGRLMRESEAAVSILDHGLLYGDGVFDTVVSWDGVLFRLADHVERLFRSMKAVAIEPPFSREDLVLQTCRAIAANRLDAAYVKWVVTRGGNDTPLMDPGGCVPNLIVLVRPYIDRAAARSGNGIALKTVSIRRTPGQCLDARVKSLNYLNLVMARMEAQAAGADEALMLDVLGTICEAPGYNVFVVAGGALHTPVRDILEGVTRATVIDIAAGRVIPVHQQDLTLYAAYTADEMFLTSTAGGLIPVTRIDGRVVGDGRPGPVFGDFLAVYRAMLGSPQHGVPIAQHIQTQGG